MASVFLIFTHPICGVLASQRFEARQYARSVRAPASGSSAAHEHLVEIRKTDFKPGGPAVIALAGAFGRLHFTQQAFISVNGQYAVGANRAVASHGGKNLVTSAGQYPAGAEFADFAQYVTRQLHYVGILERGRY